MTQPIRIQLSRAKGWRKPENTVVVSRPSKWGNPFVVGKLGVVDQTDAVDRFRRFAPSFDETVANVRRELAGKNLACWCKIGTPCHADVLLEIANKLTHAKPLPSLQDKDR